MHAICKPETPFLVLGGPLNLEALGRLPTLPKVKVGSGEKESYRNLILKIGLTYSIQS